jgi:hypothetical protein
MWRAIKKNSDKTLYRFFEELQNKKLLVIRCSACDTFHFPPRSFCPDCLNEEVELVEHSGKGEVYAFTSVANESSSGKPITFAMVDLEGVEGRIFTMVEAPYEEMSMGMEVEAGYLEKENMVIPCFKPV